MALTIAELADVRACDKADQAELQESITYKAQKETRLSVYKK